MSRQEFTPAFVEEIPYLDFEEMDKLDGEALGDLETKGHHPRRDVITPPRRHHPAACE